MNSRPPDNIVGVIFSKDRPLQLDATLRSLNLHCRDAAGVRRVVLYTTSSPYMESLYAHCATEHSDVEFVREREFKRDLLQIVSGSDAVLFVVDDNLFVSTFSLGAVCEALMNEPTALGFSLRLGRNTVYCYAMDAPQSLPAFETVKEGVLRWRWQEAVLDFGYPLEVSSSVYRTTDILPLIEAIHFHNPNTFEALLAQNATAFQPRLSHLLCFERSVTFCAPINKVQTTFDNRAGNDPSGSAQRLAEVYAAGLRLDIAAYAGFTPRACHMEIAFEFDGTFPTKNRTLTDPTRSTRPGEGPVLSGSAAPLVSVVIPCFKKAKFLREAVQSVVGQTYPNVECIIVDDGSPDETESTARQLIDEFPDKRMRYLRKENGGPASARNAGIAIAAGDLVLPLDADDRLDSRMLEMTTRVLQSDPSLSIVYTDTQRFGDMDMRCRTGPWDLDTMKRGNVLNYCALYRKDAWRTVGGYDEVLTPGYEDWEFWLKCIKHGMRAEKVPEFLFHYRVQSDSLFATARKNDAAMRAEIYERHPDLFSVPENGPTTGRKILFVVHSYLPDGVGGVEVYTHSLALEMMHRGYEVRVLTPGFDARRPAGVLEEGTVEGVSVARLNLGAFPELSGQVHNKQAGDLFEQYLDRFRPDTIHIQHLMGFTAACAEASARRGIPIFFTVHDAWLMCEQGHLMRPDGSFCVDGPSSSDRCAACFHERQNRPGSPTGDLARIMDQRRATLQRTFQLFRAVIVPTRFIAATLKRHGFEHRHMIVQPIGLPPFERTGTTGSSSIFRLTYLGNICRTKGLDVLIRALHDLGGVDVQLDIYGRVLEPKYVQDLQAAVPAGTKIQYHGPYAPRDRSRIFAATDVTVIPSRSENYSTTARESLHAGVPVVCADVGGMSEVVFEGKNGRLFPSGDARALSGILASLVRHPDELRRLKEGIDPMCSMDEDADRLEVLYRAGAASRGSIVIVTYNSGQSIRKCLESVFACTPFPIEVLAIDNASRDNTIEVLREFGDRITLIRNDENKGFSRACNQGIARSTGEYVVLLNPDTEVTPQWFERMVAHVHEGVGAVGPVSNYVAADQGIEQYIEDQALRSRSSGELAETLAARYAGRGRETRLLIGFCMMIPRRVLNAHGGLDEDLFLGNDDLEISWRLRQRGLKLIVATDVFVHHQGQESFRTEPHETTRRLVQESTDRLFAKLERHYGSGRVPPAEELWGIGWFKPSRRASVVGKVSIIILTYNQIEHTRRCIESIERCTDVKYELIFVDNGSKDGTVGWLRKLAKSRSHVRVIENKTNRGFARGCNQGIEVSTGEYLLLLNNDVVVTPSWLSGLLECHRSQERAGVVGPMTNAAGSIQRVPSVTYTAPGGLDAYAAEFRELYRHRKRVTQHLAGFCMLFTRALVDEIGPLDESFATGNFEDDDFCLRASLRGYENVIAGDVFIHHVGSASFSGNGIDYNSVYRVNRRVFQAKWRAVPPRSPEAMNLKALEMLQAAAEKEHHGDRDDAVDLLRDGLSIFPDSPRLNSELAWMLIRGKRFVDVAQFLEYVPDAVKRHREWLDVAGCAMYGLGELAFADQCVERSLAGNLRNSRALLLKGRMAADRAQDNEAEQWLLKAIEADPSLGEPYAHLAAISWRRGDQQKAFQQIQQAFVLSPTNSDIAATFAYAAREMDTWDALTARVMDAAALNPTDKGIALLLAESLIGLQAWDEALAAVTNLLGKYSLDDDILSKACILRDRMGPYKTDRATPTISLCMIVKNEERHLPRCLAAAIPVVDEVIVVDTGSNDRTMRVAYAMGAQVSSFDWNDDFSAARNYAIDQASGDWILVLDADEILSPDDHRSLRALIAGPGSRKAFGFVTRNYVTAMDLQGWCANDGQAVEEAGSGWVPSSKVRLFPRDAEIRFVNPVHEVVEPALSRLGIPLVPCAIPIHHYGRLDEQKVREKGERYAALGRKRLEEGRADDHRILLDLAAQEQELGHHDRAIDLWVRHLDRYPDDAAAYLGLGVSLSAMGSNEGALGPLRKAMELNPALREAPVKYALSLLHVGRASEASTLLEVFCREEHRYPIAVAVWSAALACLGEQNRSQNLVAQLSQQQIDCEIFFRNLSGELEVSGQHSYARALTETFPETIHVPV